MTSGIKPNDDCGKCFERLKMGKIFRYIVFEISNNRIEVSKTGARDHTLDDLKAVLQSDYAEKPCYIVLDYDRSEFVKKDHGQAQVQQSSEGKSAEICSLILLLWNPDNAGVKPKMLLASSKKALKDVLEGCENELNFSTVEELDPVELNAKTKKYR